jgi:hypothetical protein
MIKRKPPYQQGYEDGVADRKGDTPEMRSIHDHDYNDDEGSRDRMQYEAGYYDGLDGLSSKLEYMKLVRRPTKSKREVA